MSMSFGQRQKYFSKNFTNIDEIAQILNKEHGFNYEGEADFISDFAENVWKNAETKRYSFADRDLDAESQRQYDEVVAKYKDTAQWLKAPNGKPTNLTERQWVMVRTQNFKNWFGDWENDPQNASKVVDENGEPLVVYHGTRALKEFNTFEGSEHFFSSNKTVADGFLAGYDYVLEINGDEYPISTHDMEIMADLVYGDYQSYEYFVGEYEAGNNSELSYIFNELSDITHNEYKAEVFNDFDFKIKKGGRIVEAFLNIRNPVEIDYKGAVWQIGKVMPETDLQDNPQADGLIGYNIVEGGLTGELRDGSDFPMATDYVVRNSNQIKSATDNIGTYDNANDDIRFSLVSVDEAIEEADAEVSAELSNEVNVSNQKRDTDKERFITENMQSFIESEDDYDDVYYHSWSFQPPIPFSDFSRSIELEDDEYVITDADGRELGFKLSLEEAKKTILGEYWDNEVYDELDYETDAHERNLPTLLKRKFVSAINKLGLEVDEEQSAWSTNSEYIWVKAPSGDRMKIRFADHDNTHHADVSVQKDWKKAVRYVAENLENWNEEWNEDYNNSETMRFSIAEDYTEAELKSIDVFYNKIKDGVGKNENISLPIEENSDYKKIGDINKIDVSGRLITELINNGVSLRAISRQVLRPYCISKNEKNFLVCVRLKSKTGNCVVFEMRTNQGIASFYGKPLFTDKTEVLKRYNGLDKKDKVVPPTATTDLKSDSRRLEEQPYGDKLSKYSNRSQGKNSEKVEKAIFDAEKISKKLKNIDEVERMKNAVSTALRTLGLSVSERDSKSTTSKYLGIRFQDGTILQARIANHTGKRSIDITIEDDWKAGVRFVYDQLVNREDWGTRENPFPTNARLKFSFADSDVSVRRREQAIELAKKLYSRLGDGWDASQPLKPADYPTPTQEDRQDIAFSDMSFLDEDIDFICDRAEAILAKMLARSDKRNVVDAVPEIELDLEKQSIYDAVIKDALEEYKKATNIQEKAKKQIQKDLEKKIKAVKGFGLDELAINGVDLGEAVAGFNPNDIDETIGGIVEYCKQWATNEGVSYELAFAKIQATFVKCFEDLTSQIAYGGHIRSAMKSIAKLSTKTTEEVLVNSFFRFRFLVYACPIFL